jgi:hypothetical protein
VPSKKKVIINKKFNQVKKSLKEVSDSSSSDTSGVEAVLGNNGINKLTPIYNIK